MQDLFKTKNFSLRLSPVGNISGPSRYLIIYIPIILMVSGLRIWSIIRSSRVALTCINGYSPENPELGK